MLFHTIKLDKMTNILIETVPEKKTQIISEITDVIDNERIKT